MPQECELGCPYNDGLYRRRLTVVGTDVISESSLAQSQEARTRRPALIHIYMSMKPIPTLVRNLSFEKVELPSPPDITSAIHLFTNVSMPSSYQQCHT